MALRAERLRPDHPLRDVKGRVESFVNEEKSVVKAAYEAGREAMEKERSRFAKTE